MAEQVQVFYWPTETIRSDCARASSITGVQSGPTYAANATAHGNKTVTALNGNGIDIVNGYTYSYPSTYVSVKGKISVSNSCGVIGKTYTNPTPVAVQAITTASYASWPSECRPQGNYVDAVIDILHQEDIACPTWGLSDPFMTTCDGDVYMTATEGPPYNPVILVPSQFLGYDPAWGACATANAVDGGPFILPCGVYDPPHALHTASAMVPTSAADPPATTPPPPQPHMLMGPQVAQPTSPPVQFPQTTQAPVPQPVQSSSGSGSNISPNQEQGSNGAPADPKQSPDPKNDPPNSGNSGSSGNTGDPDNNAGNSGNAGSSGSQNSSPNQGSGNSTPNNQASGSSNGSPNQGSGSSNGSPGGSNQGSGSSNSGSGGSNPGSGSGNSNQTPSNQGGSQVPAQKVQPAPVPVVQTTINIGSGSQPSPAIGGFINGALGGSPAAPAQTQNPQEGNPGGDNASSGGPGSSSGQPPNGQNSAQGNGSGSNAANGGSGNAQASPGSSGSGSNAGSGSSSGSSGPSSNAQGSPGSGGTGGNAEGGGSGTGSGQAPNAQGSPANGNSGANGAGGGSGPNSAPAATFTPHPITALGQTLSAVNPSAVVVADKTLTAGGPAFSSNGNFFSLGPSGNLVAGTLAPGATPAPALTFGGSTYTASAGNFAIGNQLLTPGGAVTVAGTPISLSPQSTVAVIGTSSQSLIAPAPVAAAAPAVLTFDGSTYTANSASAFVVGGKSLTPGGLVTVFGMPISAAGDGSFAVIGSSTQSLQTAGPSGGPAVLTFGGSICTASAGNFVIGGQTLTPNGAITISGTPISAGASGSGVVVVGSTTQSLANVGPTTSPPLLTLGSSTYTATGSTFVIDSQTLTPGGSVTISGTIVSEAPSGSGLVVFGGSSTQVLGHASSTISNAALMTFGGQSFTANAAGDFVVNGQVLTPGGMITVSGTLISEAAGASNVVIGTSTEALGTATVTSNVMTFFGSGTRQTAPSLTWPILWLGISMVSYIMFLL